MLLLHTGGRPAYVSQQLQALDELVPIIFQLQEVPDLAGCGFRGALLFSLQAVQVGAYVTLR
eukprot:4322835-Lingulodinium_polyedra.AAC.1